MVAKNQAGIAGAGEFTPCQSTGRGKLLNCLQLKICPKNAGEPGMSARRRSSRRQLPQPTDLAGWRDKNHISLAAIAEQTKISRHYLEAIECGKFQRLPGGTYNISYLRQYAQAIHFDADRLVEYYRSVAPAASEAAARPHSMMERIREWLRSRLFMHSQAG